ncbi:sugar transferase [Sinomicrobium weinanense]|uniref:Sugar transferase n=1 Tax=Sinomicrobium weinanense TaxID=2842200 RepID=A0A926Q5G4_9FLAO|nr:sugar transferase [Sinomicrobium weinanense]MBC9798131.1 sugar transferase [Sinomicrobium weinanense]MBU3123708.1 sugar transferase [Sinomicrobium weinanense]
MYRAFFKRVIDFFIAFISLMLLSPILIVIVVVILCKLNYPILFKQERPGKNGNPFYLYKFRSMTNEKDVEGNLLPNEQRLPSFGKKLRATSLDELPSLLNVLKGEMSIVGPRPLRMRYLPYFTEGQNKRHEVLPGITGYAQANGRSNLSWDKKLNMDVWYVENQSFLLDMKIIFQTAVNVLKRKDTNPEGGNFEIPFDEYIKNKQQG